MNRFILFCRHNSNTLIFITLLLGSGVFSHILTSAYSIEGGRKHVALSAKLLLSFSYLLSFSLIVLYWHEFRQKFMPVNGLWAALIAWCVLSVIMGQFNGPTLIRLMGFIGCTLMGLMLFVCTHNVRHAVKHVFAVCAVIMVVNIIHLEWSVLFDVSARNIKGVFVQKNLLGHFSFLTLFLASFVVLDNDKGSRLLSALTLVSAAWLLFLSTSMTSNLLIPIAMATAVAAFVIVRYKKGWTVVIIVGVLLSTVLALYWTEFFALIGKSTSFTNRTSHWNVYGSLIESELLKGHGYGAYPSDMKQTYSVTGGPHNGYVELLYYLGLVGGMMMATLIALSLKNWWSIARNTLYKMDSLFIVSFLAVFLALNLMETYMLNRSGLYWPLFVYITLQVAWLSKSAQSMKA